jgi:hypothetical protein
VKIMGVDFRLFSGRNGFVHLITRLPETRI